MTDAPKIVKILREEERLGKLYSKPSSSYKEPQVSEVPSDRIIVDDTYHGIDTRELYKNIVERSLDGIITLDLEGMVTSCNIAAATQVGFSKNELIGKPFTEIGLFENKDIPRYRAMFTSTLQDEAVEPLEINLIRKDGFSFFAEIRINPLKENGRMIGVQAITRDVTEQKQAEEKLKKSKRKIELQNIKLKKLDELKSSFLNVASHELRTPVTPIKGYLQMLLNEKIGSITEEQKKILKIIQRNTNRLDHLIQDILDISRLESGTMRFIPEKTDVKTMVEETVETMQSSADVKNIKINLELKDDIPTLTIDKERIKQVIINLLNNAIKFSPDNSSINVKARRETDDILFEVQDFGRGIPEDKQIKIFETFYQVDSKGDIKFGGVGLGLSISKGIIQAHSGDIWVESTLGKGSIFWFTLPLEPAGNIEKKFRDLDIFGLEKNEEHGEIV